MTAPGAASAMVSVRSFSTCFAAISTLTCAKWASAILPCRSGCANSVRPFMAGRRLTAQRWTPPMRGNLRRRSGAISLPGRAPVTEQPGWRLMRAPHCASLQPRRTPHCCAATWSSPNPNPLPRLFMTEHTSQTERRSQKSAAAAPWQMPVAAEDVPETGQHFDLVADETVRAAVARVAGLRELPRLQATFEITRRGDGLHVAGLVSATVGQNCVVTLEPLTNEVEEQVDLNFVPRPAALREEGEST